MTISKCLLCQKLPEVSYQQTTHKWTLECECSKAVHRCGPGHVSYEEAEICWKGLIQYQFESGLAA